MLPSLSNLEQKEIMTREQYASELDKFLPSNTSEQVVDLIYDQKIRLIVTKARDSKLGDFRPEFGNRGHQITINHNLNPYSFLITLIHEIAHYYVWIKYKNNVKPHGVEWKNQFKILLFPFIKGDVFPDHLRLALVKHMKNPKASSTVDPNLRKELIKYDSTPVTLLEDIPPNSIFLFNQKRVFRKENKQRTRYRCFDIINKKYYLINRSAEVKLINREFIKE